MKHRRATLLLLITLVVPASPATAEGFEDMFAFMFRMMLTAMRVMTDMMDDDDDWGGSNPWSSMSPGMGMGPASAMMWPGMGMGGMPGSGSGMNPWGGGMNPWSSGMNPWSGGMNPWSSGMNPWSGGMNPGSSGMPWRGGPGGTPNPYPVNTMPMISLLNGKWFGKTGEILEIRGNRFRLGNGRMSVKGAVTIENNLLKLYTPRTRSLQVYTFVRNQTRLVLQDLNGNVLVFQQHPAAGIRNPAAGIRNPMHVF